MMWEEDVDKCLEVLFKNSLEIAEKEAGSSTACAQRAHWTEGNRAFDCPID